MNRIMKSIVVLVLTIILALGSWLMFGPQIVVVASVALLAAIILAFFRSPLSLVCIGYVLSYGLLCAYIGYCEIPGYVWTLSFAIASMIGVVGVSMVAFGLWKSLPDRRSTGLEAAP